MIFDSFMFLNELDVLDIRLNHLNSSVDCFILVESLETHNGKSKPLFYEENKNRYKQFNHKIRHIVVDKLPGGLTTDRTVAFVSENYHRNQIMRGLYDACDNDVVLVSDVDEIPKKEAVNWYKLRGDTPMGCIQKWRISFLNTVYERNDARWLGLWPGTVMIRFSDCKQTGIQHWRNQRHDVPFFKGHGGWHFTCQGGIENILYKLDSFAETQDNNEKNRDYNRIKLCLDNCIDWFTGNPMKIDNDLPDCVIKNEDQYKQMLFTEKTNK